ncbi:hypothetical protein Esti_002649 [Eimeria stiedai]
MSREGGGEQPVSSALLGLTGLDFCLGPVAVRPPPAFVASPSLISSLADQSMQTELSPPFLNAAARGSHLSGVATGPTEQLPSVTAPGSSPPRLAAPAPPVEIKLFVGGVPASLDEEPLRVLFSLFGPVSDVVVLRDRVSNRHKGCAFVRMKSLADADRAIRELSDQSLNPPLEFLYIRYAAGEAERLGFPHSGSGGAKPGVDEAKLFVGSLPKDVKEHEVRALFERFGHVQEVFLLRNNTSGSRSRNGPSGSAFVRFAYKEQALYAIANLGGKHVIPNTTRALEVRFAAAKRRNSEVREHVNSSMRIADESGGGSLAGQAANSWQVAEAWAEYLTRQGDAFGFRAGGSNDIPAHAMVRNAARGVGRGLEPALDAGLLPQSRLIGVEEDPATHQGALARLVDNVDFQGKSSDGLLADSHDSLKARRLRDKKSHGPPGANVFIFHIPNEWTSGDLLRHFSPFGPLISARIAVDRHTRRNRGFAFVNYQDVNSAIVAVGTMDGFQVNGKRLKVRIKKGEEGYAEALMLGKTNAERSGRRRSRGRIPAGQTPLEEPQDLASPLLEIAASGGSLVPQLEASVRRRREEELLLRQQREAGDAQHLHALQQQLQHDQHPQQHLGYHQQPERDQRVPLLAEAVDTGARQAPDGAVGVLPDVDDLSTLLTRRLQLRELIPSVDLLRLSGDEDVGAAAHAAS